MTRRSWLSFLFALAAPAISAPAAAQKFCDPQAPEKCSAPIKKGEPAPYDGQVLTVPLAIDLGQKAAHCDERIRLDVDFAKEVAAVKLSEEQELHRIDNQTADAIKEMMRQRIAEAAPKWYEQPVFVVAVTATCTVALYALAMKSASWTKLK